MSFQSYLYFRGGTYTDLELIIMNRIPVEKNVEYVINSEPQETLKKRHELYQKKIENNLKMQARRSIIKQRKRKSSVS